MDLLRDPVTGSIISEAEQQQDEEYWQTRTNAFITTLKPLDAKTLCDVLYPFLNEQSRGVHGKRPRLPLCAHALDSYVSDHALLTSAICYCLGYEQPDIDLMRLAALAHEFPQTVQTTLVTKVDNKKMQAFLLDAWSMLREQGQQLATALQSDDSIGQFGNAKPEYSDKRMTLLWSAHLTASARLHNTTFSDAEGELVKTIANKADFAQHPLNQSGTPVGLVYGGVTKVKQYVFESLRLPEIRGASVLLDRINQVDLLALWGWQPPELVEAEYVGAADFHRVEQIHTEQSARGQQVRTAFKQTYGLTPLTAPECIIYAGGGNILALAPAQFVEPLADAIEWIYTDQTLVANSAAVGRTFSLLELQYGYQPERFWCEEYETVVTNPTTQALADAYYSYPDELRPSSAEGLFYARKTFGELVTVLTTEFYRRRAGQEAETTQGTMPRQSRAIPHFELPPFAMKCYSCGVRPAVMTVRNPLLDPNDVPPGQSPKIFCQACARKRMVGHRAKQERGGNPWFADPFGWEPQGVTAWEQEFIQFLLRQRSLLSTLPGEAELLAAYYADLPQEIQYQVKKLEEGETKRRGVTRARAVGLQQLSNKQREDLVQSATAAVAQSNRLVRLLVEVEALQERASDLVRPAATLGEIAAASRPEGYIGLIYADGNNVGAQVAKISTPAAYRQFATRLEQANKAAVFTALAQHLHPYFLREAVDPDRPDRRNFWVHPFEIVTIGGDDVMLFVPGDKALTVISTISQTLEELLGQRLTAQEQGPPRYAFQRFQRHTEDTEGWLRPDPQPVSSLTRISASAGVVVAQEHTPIFFLVNLVEDLQKSAKKLRKQLGAAPPSLVKGRNWARVEDSLCEPEARKVAWNNKRRGGTVDFLILKGLDIVTSNLDDFRRRALEREAFLGEPDGHPLGRQPKEKLYLTSRPYTFLELAGLVQLAQELANLPTSQQRLVERTLFQGRLPATVNYLYLFSRLRDPSARQKLDQHFHRAWATMQNQVVTAPWRAIMAEDDSPGPHGKKDDGCLQGEWETIWHDLMEIAEFVEKGGKHASGAD